jgi:hypothetical protein
MAAKRKRKLYRNYFWTVTLDAHTSENEISSNENDSDRDKTQPEYTQS